MGRNKLSHNVKLCRANFKAIEKKVSKLHKLLFGMKLAGHGGIYEKMHELRNQIKDSQFANELIIDTIEKGRK